MRWIGAVVLALAFASGARGHVELEAVLTPDQEIPPVVNSTGRATATFTFMDENNTLAYTITITQPLTSDVTLAHIHEGGVGQESPPRVSLDTSLSGTADLSGLANRDDFLAKLFSGQTYVNLHTVNYGDGEIRGQIELSTTAGTCSCRNAPNHGQFVKCVNKAIKKLDKSERKEEAIIALKRAAKRSSCGKKKNPKKAVACCLPRTPEENIVVEALCVAVKESKCAGLGGTAKAPATCTPTNPCSPSGAFLDEAGL
ncbi:MAG TPA: CHRD domain-containing protein [Candidatus Binatia bacterium]|nr:CHRD domain-containing protein [Candidatus Binatia bacterium]